MSSFNDAFQSIYRRGRYGGGDEDEGMEKRGPKEDIFLPWVDALDLRRLVNRRPAHESV